MSADLVKVIKVSEDDLEEFEFAVDNACVRRSHVPIQVDMPEQKMQELDVGEIPRPGYFRREDGSLVISFDKDWYPFLCSTTGHNTGTQCWYIQKSSRLIQLIAATLHTPEQRNYSKKQGGRVFLDANVIRRHPKGHSEIVFLKWILPRESRLLRDRLKRLIPRKSNSNS